MASFAEGKGDEGGAAARPALTVPGQADAILARMETMEDLEPDNMTPDEAEKLPPLLAGVLEALGRDEIPQDWTRHLYVRGALLRFLRGRNGKVAAAIVMLTEAIQWYVTRRISEAPERGRGYVCDRRARARGWGGG